MEIKQNKTIKDQITHILLENIKTGKYVSGERLPSESDLSDELSVSRASVRSAMATLAASGLITRKQGDGTYVTANGPGLTSIASSVWEFMHLISNTGKKCSLRGLEAVQRKPNEDDISIFELESEEEVISLKRLFYANEDPIIFSLNIFPVTNLKQNCTLEQLDITKGLDDFVESYFDFKIMGVNIELTATLGDEDIVNLLEVNSGEPLLNLVEIFHGHKDKPIVYSNNYIRSFTLPIHVLKPW